jgi:hypothetical protein
MNSNPPIKTKYTGEELMNLFKDLPDEIKHKYPKNSKYLKYTANLAKPSMLKKMKSANPDQ